MTVERLRAERGIAPHVKLAYAGRLDPMASGALLVLTGDECKRQKAYHGLDKEYEFEVLLGVSSDTGDVLGLAEYDQIQEPTIMHVHDCRFPFSSRMLMSAARSFLGTHTFPYPAFSSKTVGGVQLHRLAAEGRLNKAELPVREATVYRLRLIGVHTIGKDALHAAILKKIGTLPQVTDEEKAWGRDFRREEIIARWRDIFAKIPDGASFQIARFSCICSSGTYMRTLAEKIAEHLSTRGLAFSIHRTKIGRYIPVLSKWGVWVRLYC